MNLKNLHSSDIEVSAKILFKGEVGTSATIQLKKNAELKEHISKTPALLLCVLGLTNYNDEKGSEIILNPGDFVHIEPNVKHFLIASLDSQLILIK